MPLDVRVDDELVVVGAVPLGHAARPYELGVARVRKSDRERLHGTGRIRRHHGDDGGAVHSAREERADRDVGDEAAPHRDFDEAAQLARQALIAPTELGADGLAPVALEHRRLAALGDQNVRRLQLQDAAKDRAGARHVLQREELVDGAEIGRPRELREPDAQRAQLGREGDAAAGIGT